MVLAQQLYAKQAGNFRGTALIACLSTKVEQARTHLSDLYNPWLIPYDLGSESGNSHQKQKSVLGPIGCFS